MRSFVHLTQVERNEKNKPQTMFFGSVTLKSPFSQSTPTVIEATSRKLYTLQSSELESPQFDDKVSSFGAVRISDSIMINTGNCVKCTVDGEVGSISIMDFLYIIHSLLLISTGKKCYTPCLCSENGRCDHEKLLPREHIRLPLSIA